jgi:hypothetical protein
MAEDLSDFISPDIINWNYNEYINKPGVDPYNDKKKLDPSLSLSLCGVRGCVNTLSCRG